AMALALLFPNHTRLFFVVFAFVAATRVAVGAHFPSDVAAGYALGIAATLLVGAVFLLNGRVFQLCGGKVWRLPVVS
ncbi:phosphatase PAP2 family protein, partial [Mycobacterium tuberculosis]|nr:phosphatase PAP2 family protein [Mycobacterium tuberculosis]